MTLVLDDFHRLKEKVERLKRDRDRAVGALSELKKRLLREFKVKTLKDAKKLLKALLDREIGIMRKYAKARAEFDKKWGKLLEGVGDE